MKYPETFLLSIQKKSLMILLLLGGAFGAINRTEEYPLLLPFGIGTVVHPANQRADSESRTKRVVRERCMSIFQILLLMMRFF